MTEAVAEGNTTSAAAQWRERIAKQQRCGASGGLPETIVPDTIRRAVYRLGPEFQ